MNDYDDEYDQDVDTWVYLWRNDRHHPLTRFCIWWSIAAVAGWVLIQMLTA